MTARPDLSRVQVLLFDLYGTLVDWRTSIGSALDAFGHHHSINRDWSQFADRWRHLNQLALEQVRCGARPWTSIEDLHRQNLVKLMADFRIAGISEGETTTLSGLWSRLQPWPDVAPALPHLATRARLVLLADAGLATPVVASRHVGVTWDQIVEAEPEHIDQSRRAWYRAAAAQLGLHPSQIMVVSARDSYLEAAGRDGFRTALVVRSTEQATAPALAADWDLVCSDLVQLVANLGVGGQADAGRSNRGLAASSLSRTRSVALAVVVAIASALAFNSGYQLGNEQRATSAVSEPRSTVGPAAAEPEPHVLLEVRE